MRQEPPDIEGYAPHWSWARVPIKVCRPSTGYSRHKLRLAPVSDRCAFIRAISVEKRSLADRLDSGWHRRTAIRECVYWTDTIIVGRVFLSNNLNNNRAARSPLGSGSESHSDDPTVFGQLSNRFKSIRSVFENRTGPGASWESGAGMIWSGNRLRGISAGP